MQAAKQVSDTVIKVAEAATLAAAGTPAAPGVKAAEEATKAACAAAMGAAMTVAAGLTGADKHTCSTPLPIPPHGPGVVINGSPTVLVNGLPCVRVHTPVYRARLRVISTNRYCTATKHGTGSIARHGGIEARNDEQAIIDDEDGREADPESPPSPSGMAPGLGTAPVAQHDQRH